MVRGRWGSWGRAGVIALAGLYGYGGAVHANFYLVVAHGGVGAAGNIGQGIFMAGFLGDLGIEFFDVGAGGGVIDVAAGVVRIVGQALEFFLGQAAADREAVDGDVVVEEGLEGILI